MVDTIEDKLERARQVLIELKEQGYSNKDLNQVELIMLMEMGSHVQETGTHSNSI